MWIWIIIIAVVLGALWGFLNSDSNNAGEGAAQGAMAGGCMAAGCLLRLALAAIGILVVLWLFSAIFGGCND
jgi:hypothetical protein